jgi:hypothetical protein
MDVEKLVNKTDRARAGDRTQQDLQQRSSARGCRISEHWSAEILCIISGGNDITRRVFGCLCEKSAKIPHGESWFGPKSFPENGGRLVPGVYWGFFDHHVPLSDWSVCEFLAIRLRTHTSRTAIFTPHDTLGAFTSALARLALLVSASAQFRHPRQAVPDRREEGRLAPRCYLNSFAGTAAPCPGAVLGHRPGGCAGGVYNLPFLLVDTSLTEAFGVNIRV